MAAIIYNTNSSHGINYLPKRYNENISRSTKVKLDENNQVMKKVNSIQQKH